MNKYPLIKINSCIILLLIFGNSFTEKLYAQTVQDDFEYISTITNELDAPSRMAVSPTGLIYVADVSTKTVKKYDTSGMYLGTLAYTGVPLSIAISDDNEIFIGDADNNQITRISPDGSSTVIYKASIFPTDMVTGSDRLLYIVDAMLKKVIVMDFGGNIIRNIGLGTLLAPRCIAFDRQNKRIIVSEHGGVGSGFNLHSEIRIFGLTGNLISTFGGYGNTDGKFYRIQGLTVGHCGNIYVSDNFQGKISVFNPNGGFITRFGQFGTQAGELNVPMDIDFDILQNLWISSMNNGSLEVFSITDSLPSATIPAISKNICSGDSVDIPISFTGTPPYTFTYSVNDINPTTVSNTYSNPYILKTSVPGTYKITAMSDTLSAATCLSGTTDIVLDPFPMDSMISGFATICSGTSFDIPVKLYGAKPFSFTYTVDGLNPKTINDIYSDSYIIPATDSGNYAISSLSGGACTVANPSGNFVVSVFQSPTAYISNIDTSICMGQSVLIPVNFTGIGPWSFTFTVNESNPVEVINILDNPYNLIVSNAGRYEISSITDANCSSGEFTGTANIYFKPQLSAEIVSKDANICSGGSTKIEVEFNGRGPFSFTYTQNGTNPIIYSNISLNPFFISVSQEGTYELIDVSAEGCQGLIIPNSFVVSANQDNVQTDDITICSGDYISWHGNYYSTSGTYLAIYQTVNGCDSIYTLNLKVIPLSRTLNVNVFLENLYNNGLMNQAQNIDSSQFGPDISDQITVELHDVIPPYNLVYKKDSIDLFTNGLATISNLLCQISGSYYIVIKHRNSIETWSSQPIDFTDHEIINYDFTIGIDQAFGSNLKIIDNISAIYCGDVSQDGVVDGSDMSAVDNSSTAMLKGYYPEDVNGDGIVDGSDMAMIDNNSNSPPARVKRP